MRQVETSIKGSGDRPLKLLISYPDHAPEAKPAPALLMIYEVFGLTPEMRRLAARFAENGYVTLIPDLFDGRGNRALCIARAVQAIRSGRGAEYADLEAARLHLAALPGVDSARLGVVGFCLGGGFAIMLATRGGYRVSAPFYGDVPRDEAVLKTTCPTVASFGGRDRRLLGAAARFERALDAFQIPHDFKLYPDAGHAFMTRTEGGVVGMLAKLKVVGVGYHEAAAEDSWRRMLGFFGEHL